MTSNIQATRQLTCPVCDGAGEEKHAYRFESERRNDLPQGYLQRLDECWLCGGKGRVTQETFDGWKRVQAYPVCPICKGQGGKYYWTWDEQETRTRKQFVFEPCSLCHGEKHVSPDQLAVHERERRKVRFWGVGCTLLVVIGGLFAVTQVVSLVVYRTPWVQCCAPPHVVFVSGMIVISRKMGWF